MQAGASRFQRPAEQTQIIAHRGGFLLFLCFRKVTPEIFSELDETKAEPPIFPDTKMESRAEREEARRQAHHRVAHPPLATPPGGVGPWSTP
jgi:hypothetical protein